MKLFFIFLLVIVLLLQVFSEALTIIDSMHSHTDQDSVLELTPSKDNKLSINDNRKGMVSVDGAAMQETQFKKFTPRRINCGYACARRCSKASRKNVCHRACKACCARCNCVPPGTYGNKQVCPCYARLTTRGNKPKCP